jgi:prepilin-type N-terminal cleavage/methylation domain-containing protein
MSKRRRSPRGADAGFTLVELLVSTAIAGAIVVVMAAAIGVVLRNDTVSAQHNDVGNSSLGLANLFGADVSSTPDQAALSAPDQLGRAVGPGTPIGCAGAVEGLNVAQFTWSERLDDGSGSTYYRVSYRLVETEGQVKLRRYECTGPSLDALGSLTYRTVAGPLAPIPGGWNNDPPAVLAPADGLGALSLTITQQTGEVQTVQSTTSNPNVTIPNLAESPEPQIEADLTAAPEVFAVGETIEVTLTIRNTGNVAVSNVAAAWSPNLTEATPCQQDLDEAQEQQCTAAHTVTQADFDAGSMLFSADVSATHPARNPDAVHAETTLDVPDVVTLSIVSFGWSQPGYTQPNEVIPFTLELLNTGNITITSIDPVYDSAVVPGACAPLPVAPGQTATCTSDREVTADEFNAKAAVVVDVAVTGSTNVLGTTPAVLSSATVTFQPVPALEITNAQGTPNPYASGQTVAFTAQVKNTGNVALTDVTGSWSNVDSLGPHCSIASPGTLAPGASIPCNGDHVATPADVSAQHIDATLSAAATYDPGGANMSVSATAAATVAADTSTEVHIAVSLSANPTTFDDAGQPIQLTVTVRNDGLTTVNSFTTTFNTDDGPISVTGYVCNRSSLAPRNATDTDTATCVATYTTRTNDRGSALLIEASVRSGVQNFDSSPVTISYVVVEDIAIVNISPSESPFDDPDDVITYTVTVTNTGTVRLDNVRLTYSNAVAGSCTGLSGGGLNAGSSATCTATRQISTDSERASGTTTSVTVMADRGTSTTSDTESITVPSAVACSVTTPSYTRIGSPSRVSRVSGSGPRPLSTAVTLTIRTAGACNNLRVRYYPDRDDPNDPNDSFAPPVVGTMTFVATNVWSFTIPGVGMPGAANWVSGSAWVEILPAAGTSDDPIPNSPFDDAFWVRSF